MMICGMTVKRECAYSKICGMADCYVADDSECADLIVEIAGRLEGLDARGGLDSETVNSIAMDDEGYNHALKTFARNIGPVLMAVAAE